MRSRKMKPLLLEDISQYKNEIYGFSILWIMLFHAIAIVQLNYTLGYSFLEILNDIIGYGNVGVEIFLFCSGIFLYFSYHRNPDILCFIKKRFSRLFWPVAIITGWYWAWLYIIEENNIAVFITKMTLLDFWVSGQQQIWFVACIFICYLLYPYVYAFLFESKFANGWIRLLCLVGATVFLTLVLQEAYPNAFRNMEIALSRFPVFFVGCFAGKFVYEKKTLPGWTYIICLFMDVLVFCVLQLQLVSGVWVRWVSLFGGVSMTFTIILILNILKCKPIRKFLAFLGTISLNLYVSHILMISLYKLTPFYEHKRLFHYLIVLVISILVAWIAEKIIGLIHKKHKPKKCLP